MEGRNLKLWESFLSGLAGAVIAAVFTYWSAVQKTANDAEIKEILASTKEQYLMQIKDSIKEISKAEASAGYTVANANKAVLNSQKIISELSSTGEKAKQILAQLEQTAKDSNKTAADLNDKDKLDIRDALVNEIKNIETPVGAVLAFNLNQCPDGWTDYIPAYGRFIRGIDKGGNVDPEGLRVAGSTQEDSLKSHTHIYNDIFFSELGGQWDVTNALGSRSSDNDNKGWGIDRPTQATGEQETRSKNVALLYCERK